MTIRRTEFTSGLRVVTERMPGVRSVSLGFWVLAGSRDEAPADQRLQPLPGAPAVQGHEDPERAGHRRGVRRRRRRPERLHREGVHVLLRAGARPRPGDGGRPPRRHAAALGDPHGGPRRRAAGDPRGDQHARGLARGPRARPVHRDAVAGPSARPADPRHARRRSRRRRARPVKRFYRRHYVPGNFVVAAAGNVRHDDLLSLLGRLMETGRALRRGRRPTWNLRERAAARRRRRAQRLVNRRKTEQAHICSGRTASRAPTPTGSRSAS